MAAGEVDTGEGFGWFEWAVGRYLGRPGETLGGFSIRWLVGRCDRVQRETREDCKRNDGGHEGRRVSL